MSIKLRVFHFTALFVAFCQTDGFYTIQQAAQKSNDIGNVYVEKQRLRRSPPGNIFQVLNGGLAFIREMKAWRGLTKEAFPVVYTETRQVFTKNGGIEAALKDFDSIRPTNVRVIETLDGTKKTGMVGNMNIEIQTHRDIKTADLTMSKVSGISKPGHRTEILYY